MLIQVPLSTDKVGNGGQPVFLLGSGAVQLPSRQAGWALGHHGDVVHGVTTLMAGRRYGLFVLRARSSDVAAAALPAVVSRRNVERRPCVAEQSEVGSEHSGRRAGFFELFEGTFRGRFKFGAQTH